MNPKPKLHYEIYRNFQFDEDARNNTPCGDEVPVSDKLADLGHVMVIEKQDEYEEVTEKSLYPSTKYTLFTDNALDTTDIASFYIAAVKMLRKNPSSDAYVIYTTSKLENEMNKFFIEDNDGEEDSVSNLFNVGGKFLRVNPSVETMTELALAINRFFLSQFVDVINNHKHGKTVIDAELRQSMMSKCPSSSCSIDNFYDFIASFISLPRAETSSKSYSYLYEDFKTLDHLGTFITRFRLACDQPSLGELQGSTKHLLRGVERFSGNGKQLDEAYGHLFEDLTRWYTSKWMTSNEHRVWDYEGQTLRHFFDKHSSDFRAGTMMGDCPVTEEERKCFTEILTLLKARWIANGKPCPLSEVSFTLDDVHFNEDDTVTVVGVKLKTRQVQTLKRVLSNELMREEMGWPEKGTDWNELHTEFDSKRRRIV